MTQDETNSYAIKRPRLFSWASYIVTKSKAHPDYPLISTLNDTYRNAKGVAEVITLSRSFMSSTAKAKTAKLSARRYL
jgi:hypothetical protein